MTDMGKLWVTTDDNGDGSLVELNPDFTEDQWSWVLANHPKRIWGIRVNRFTNVDHARKRRHHSWLWNRILYGDTPDMLPTFPANEEIEPHE